jgi:hypothetical protein
LCESVCGGRCGAVVFLCEDWDTADAKLNAVWANTGAESTITDVTRDAIWTNGAFDTWNVSCQTIWSEGATDKAVANVTNETIWPKGAADGTVANVTSDTIWSDRAFNAWKIS